MPEKSPCKIDDINKVSDRHNGKKYFLFDDLAAQKMRRIYFLKEEKLDEKTSKRLLDSLSHKYCILIFWSCLKLCVFSSPQGAYKKGEKVVYCAGNE